MKFSTLNVNRGQEISTFAIYKDIYLLVAYWGVFTISIFDLANLKQSNTLERLELEKYISLTTQSISQLKAIKELLFVALSDGQLCVFK
jgi:sensor histidine kinase regulating citrate/malate metabolism